MIRTAICDDEANTRAYLASLIQKQPYACEIAEYASAGECLKDREMDVLFLDIELDLSGSGLSEMALAKKLRQQKLNPRLIIIFVTGYEQYVFDAFDVDAFQYLLKPVDEQKFAQVFARAMEQIQSERKSVRALTMQSSSVSRTIPLDDIYYIESSNHQVILHLREETLAYYARIRDLEEKLRDLFFRIHKGYLVNRQAAEERSPAAATKWYRRTVCAWRNGQILCAGW